METLRFKTHLTTACFAATCKHSNYQNIIAFVTKYNEPREQEKNFQYIQIKIHRYDTTH